MNTATTSPKAPLLDPLALSAETRGRFRMLLIAAFVMTWSLATLLAPLELGAPSASPETTGPEIEVQGATELYKESSSDATNSAPSKDPDATSRQTSEILHLLTSLGLLAVFTLLYSVFLKLSTRRTTRRSSAQRLEPQTNPILAEKLAALARRAGLDSGPEWYLKPGVLDGLAFGSAKRPILAVGGEAGRLERRWSDLNQAVVLHELGHVVNDDIGTREGARAAWLALTMISALAATILLLRGDSWDELGRLLARLIVAAALGLILWAGLVRGREFYADWRVVQWGFGTELRRRLLLQQSFPSAEDRGHTARHSPRLALVARWKRLLSMHPSNQHRLRVLENPCHLFRTSTSLVLATGVLLGLVMGHLGLALLQLSVLVVSPILILSGFKVTTLAMSSLVAATPFFVLAVTCLPLTYWVVDALGTQTLRTAVGDLADGRSESWGYAQQLRGALAFAGGVELGFWITPVGLSGWSETGWMLLWFSGLTLLIWVWLIQARALGRLALGAWPGSGTGLKLERRLHVMLTALLLPVFVAAMAGRAFAVWLARPQDSIILGSSPSESASLLVFLSLFLLGIALLASSILGGLTFFLLEVWLRGRSIKCGKCRAPWDQRQTVGSICLGCGDPIVSWLYSQPSQTAIPGVPSGEIQ